MLRENYKMNLLYMKTNVAGSERGSTTCSRRDIGHSTMCMDIDTKKHIDINIDVLEPTGPCWRLLVVLTLSWLSAAVGTSARGTLKRSNLSVSRAGKSMRADSWTRIHRIRRRWNQ